MILTTSIKQPCTTTEHNNKGYIFTLYLFMLLCVVGNCLLFYCSCTGNCENCCGINGLLRIANIDQDGKVDGNKILHKLFINGENKASVNVSIYRGSTEKDYEDAKKEFLNSIDTICKTHLSAYVEVGDTARYFIHCKDANSIKYNGYYYGLFYWSEATKIEILSCGSEIENMSYMFAGCSKLTELNLSNFNTNKVTDMYYMFAYCSGLTNLDLSKFNTKNVKNMSFMFNRCSGLTNLDLSKFNTDNVTNMSNMFNNCRSLTNIKFPDNLNTTNVKDMQYMFYECSSLTNLDLSNFNTTKVTNMESMFYYCSSLTNLDLSSFNTINVTNMCWMFSFCSKLSVLDLSKFNTDKVTDMNAMFYNCFKNEATLICKASTIKNITEKENSYLIITNEKKNNDEINNIIVNNKNLDQVYICSVKREEKKINHQIISVYKFKDMPSDVKIDGKQIVNEKFADRIKYVQIGSEGDKQACKKIIESINPTGETYLSAYVEVKDNDNKIQLRCFIHCKNANSIYNTVYYYGLFQESAATKIEILSCGSKIENINHMFYKCSSLLQLDLSKLKTGNVKYMNSMFAYCESLSNLDLSSLDTENVTNMSNMFNNCSSLTNIKFPDNLNTTNVKDMRYMFYECSSLLQLDLSKFNTNTVKDMNSMFYYCSSLTILNLSSFNTNNVTDMCWMFSGCNSLKELDLSNFNTKKVIDMFGMFSKCFTEKRTSTLICTTSTIQKTEKKNSCLIIQNEKKTGINKIITNKYNPDKIYKCTVKRVGSDPEITEVEEYQQKQ